MISKNFLHSLTIFLIFIFLGYGLILSILSEEGTAPNRFGNSFFPYLNEKPLTEDSYYMLTVAWNIAKGKGFCYNYDIKTTGVQPLKTLIYSFFAYLVQKINGDKYLLPRLIIFYGFINQVIFVFIFVLILKLLLKNYNFSLLTILTVFSILMNFKTLLIFTNGLETGIYLTILSIFILIWLQVQNTEKIETRSMIVFFGLLIGLIFLTRYDSLIFIIVFFALGVIRKKIKLKTAIFILIIAFLIYLPWQLYILSVTNQIFQSSLLSQTSFTNFSNFKLNTYSFLVALGYNLTPFLFTGNLRDYLTIYIGSIYLVILTLLSRKFLKRDMWINENLSTLKFIIFCFIIYAIVFLLFSTSPHFFNRYLAFLQIMSYIFFIPLIINLSNRFRNFLYYFLIISIFTFFTYSYLYFHSGKSARSFAVRVDFAKKNIPNTLKIGSFQSGIFGYFCENVVNLDGKMDVRAYYALKNKKMNEFLDDSKINILIEWNDIIINVLNADYLYKNWILYSKDIGDGRSVCYVRKEFAEILLQFKNLRR